MFNMNQANDFFKGTKKPLFFLYISVISLEKYTPFPTIYQNSLVYQILPPGYLEP